PLWWSSLAYTQSPNNLWFLQWGQIAGPNISTAFLVLINGILAEIILLCWNYKIKPFFMGLLLAIPASLIITIHLTGYFLDLKPLADQPKNMITVGIIQGNIPNKIKLYPEGLEKALAAYTQGYQDLVKSGSQVVLTPEGALPYFWKDIVNYSPFYQAILQAKIPVWLGAYGHQKNEEQNYTNSLFSVNSEGKLIGRYDKVKLVPLGEYIPLKAILGKVISRLSPLKGELSPGNPQQVFNTTFGTAIVSICYESAFHELIREQVKLGGEFILSSANNAHYSDKMPAQHHALDVMRAIESDRWVARATNTGYSAIISPKGETLWLSKLNNYQIHQGIIYRRQTETFYVQYGDLLTPFLTAVTLIGWLIPAALFRVQSQRKKPSF
ncbi:MAG: apolipoprotein N-acyltransferase, partial [Microcystaceae cyanobacterium]